MVTSHLANGDSGRQRLEESGIPGTIAAWRDMLWDGPVATDLRVFASLDRRARWVQKHYGVATEDYIAHHQEDEAWLDARAQDPDESELVLWFEDDHFCEINLLYILSRLAAPTFRRLKVSLVFAPGPQGLADLNFDLRSAFVLRERLGRKRLARTGLAWRRYCDPDPRAFASTPLPPPFEAFTLRWRGRFPDAHGLNVFERTILARLALKETSASTLLRELCHKASAPARRLGLGDHQFWRILNDLHQRELVKIDGPTLPRYDQADASNSAARTRLSLTIMGARCLEQEGGPPSLAPVGGAEAHLWTRRELERVKRPH